MALLGRYEIRSSLGGGGTGMVYKAFDRTLEEPVAVKVLRKRISDAVSSAKSLTSEIKAARRVRSAFVCAVHDFGEHGHIRFITMELVEGSTLKETIRTHGPFSLAQGLPIAVEMAEGLGAMHELGILHRDLKSANVMLDRHGHVRIMDLGIAKILGDVAQSTKSAESVGTPEYLSPEQASGSPLDPRSDLYSMGVVLYELFAGRVPFRADAPVGVVLKQLKEPVVFSETPSLPPGLRGLLLTLLEKNPASRVQTAADLHSRLRALDRELLPKPVSATSGRGNGDQPARSGQRPTHHDPGNEPNQPGMKRSQTPDGGAPPGSLAEALTILSSQEASAQPIAVNGPPKGPVAVRAIPTPATTASPTASPVSETLDPANRPRAVHAVRNSRSPPPSVPLASPIPRAAGDSSLFVPLQPLRSPKPRRSQSPWVWTLALLAAVGASLASIALLWLALDRAFGFPDLPKGQQARTSPTPVERVQAAPREKVAARTAGGVKVARPSPGAATTGRGASTVRGRPPETLLVPPAPAQKLRPTPAPPSRELPPTPSLPVLALTNLEAPAPAPTLMPPGRIRVEAFPFAEVAVDGKEVGRTPVTVDVDAGSHTVTFSWRGFPSVQKTVMVRPGTTEVSFVDFGSRPDGTSGPTTAPPRSTPTPGPSVP